MATNISLFEWVFLISSILVMLLGAFLILHALSIFRAQRKGTLGESPKAEVRVLGVKIRGRRPLVIFVLGVVLVALPLKYSFNLLTGTYQAAAAVSIVPEPEDYTTVEDLPGPTYEGFRFLKDIRVIDLRARLPVPEDKKDEKYSPVTWTRYTLLRKLADEHEHVDFQFGTSGVDLHPRCLTHAYQLRKSTKPHRHQDKTLRHTWQISVDVKNVEVDRDFLVINEVTYWNAFRNERREWAAMEVSEETDVIGLIILFREDKPFHDARLYSYPHGSEERQQFRGPSTFIPGENGRVLVWKVDNPKSGYTYEIDWAW